MPIKDLPQEVLDDRGEELENCAATLNRFFVYRRAVENGITLSPKDIGFRDNDLFETISTSLANKKG